MGYAHPKTFQCKWWAQPTLQGWPLAIVWSVPEAAIDADNINKRQSVYYYTFGPGQEEVKKASAPVQSAPVVPASVPAAAPVVVPASAPISAPAAVPATPAPVAN